MERMTHISLVKKGTMTKTFDGMASTVGNVNINGGSRYVFLSMPVFNEVSKGQF